ncbi:hypothetical protein Tco_0866948, partial [Tanacetum coccineum]
MELEKAVKERDELKDKIAKWEESSKNLDEILNSQMSARDKTGLGYSTQLNELSSNHETDSENSFSVFDGRSSDEDFHTSTANDRDRVIIEDWNSDDEEEVSEVQKVIPENQTVRTRDDKSDCTFHDKKSQESKPKNVVNTGKREGKPVWDNTKRVDHQNFSKYPHLSETFVPSGVLTKTGLHRPSASTASLSVSTARPVCIARPSINTVRPNVSTARPSCTTRPNVCTARPSINTVRPNVSTARPACTTRPNVSTARPAYVTRPTYPRMENVRPRGSCSPIKRSYSTKPAIRPKDIKQDVKTFGVKNMTIAGKRALVNTGKGKLNIDLKKSRWVWRPKGNYL